MCGDGIPRLRLCGGVPSEPRCVQFHYSVNHEYRLTHCGPP